MTPALLARCGAALYGEQWQTDLSKDLDVADRTVRRWLAGDTPIPAGINIDMMRIMLDRAQALDDLVDECRACPGPR